MDFPAVFTSYSILNMHEFYIMLYIVAGHMCRESLVYINISDFFSSQNRSHKLSKSCDFHKLTVNYSARLMLSR